MISPFFGPGVGRYRTPSATLDSEKDRFLDQQIYRSAELPRRRLHEREFPFAKWPHDPREEAEKVLEHLKRVTPTAQKEADSFSRELAWLEEHGADFAGKWVALRGDRLLASGLSAPEVRKEAERRGESLPLMVFMPENDLPFGGW